MVLSKLVNFAVTLVTSLVAWGVIWFLVVLTLVSSQGLFLEYNDQIRSFFEHYQNFGIIPVMVLMLLMYVVTYSIIRSVLRKPKYQEHVHLCHMTAGCITGYFFAIFSKEIALALMAL